jgi:branched-chain amino acid aminotransferase
MNSICLNGKIISSSQPVLMADNKSYRYGDGIFETMKVYKGKFLLEELHVERLLRGIRILKLEMPSLLTIEKLLEQVIQLCLKNKCVQLARVRLSLFRGNGGVYEGDNLLHYLIECWPLNESLNQLNENGLVIGLFPDARKSCDVFANIKSASYLPYAMAARYAKENKWNDCLLMNTFDRIADATIANLFLIQNNHIITPALEEGPVAGVMRNYLFTQLAEAGYTLEEGKVTADDLLTADELFLTNAITGIRWVKNYANKTYSCNQTTKIYNQFVKTILS